MAERAGAPAPELHDERAHDDAELEDDDPDVLVVQEVVRRLVCLFNSGQQTQTRHTDMGPTQPKEKSWSLQRALLTPWVNHGSRYRCGKST